MNLKDLEAEKNREKQGAETTAQLQKISLGFQGSNQALLKEVIRHYMLHYSHLNFLEQKKSYFKIFKYFIMGKYLYSLFFKQYRSVFSWSP